MKALFVGLGSIGKRHLKDFYNECIKRKIDPEIHALRRSITDLGELNSLVAKQITQVTDADYDVVFITNPTNLHIEALRQYKEIGKFYFVEKPIFERPIYSLSELNLNEANTYVAAPMRHTFVYKTLKQVVNQHKVFSSRIICSSYLPEWRPGIDYRKNYSALRDMGGGVTLDLIHEIDYITDLFGYPEKSYNFRGKYSNLEITSDDLSIYIMKFTNLLCEVHLDYFGRVYRRTCEVFTENGSYIADFHKETVTEPNGNIIDCHKMQNEEFISEMQYFVDFVMGSGVVFNSPQNAYRSLQISLGV